MVLVVAFALLALAVAVAFVLLSETGRSATGGEPARSEIGIARPVAANTAIAGDVEPISGLPQPVFEEYRALLATPLNARPSDVEVVRYLRAEDVRIARLNEQLNDERIERRVDNQREENKNR
ncbi:MAG: hypothetical protein HYY84_13210 [Deltaproteobacteria bacterium]|nr:hypothetical protein [Deltaproteobacteria bacterium]